MFRMSRCSRGAAAAVASPRVFDTHCHLNLHQPGRRMSFHSDFAEVHARAVSKNVAGMTVVGIDLATSIAARDVAMKLSSSSDKDSAGVKTLWSAGLHPHNAMRCEEELPKILKLVEESRISSSSKTTFCAAIGETGLDYFKSPPEAQRCQKQSLEMHLDACDRLGLPIIIHCRDSRPLANDAHRDLFTILENHQQRRRANNNSDSNNINGVMHCFSSDVESMQRAVHLGLFISFPCTISYPKSHALREACTACPLDRIVVETDAPFLPPADMRGQRNEPRFVWSALDAVAECKSRTNEFLGRSREDVRRELAEAVWRNSLRLFNLSSPVA